MDWESFYKTEHNFKNSTFSDFVFEQIKGDSLVELGCGDGRDLKFFIKNGINACGIDKAFEGRNITKQDVLDFIKNNNSPEYVYTRFFWHIVNRDIQLEILKWVKGTLFIEARTAEDRPLNLFTKHKRYLINVSQLVKDLKDNGFQITYLHEGRGLSVLKGEDPYLVRIVAKKVN